MFDLINIFGENLFTGNLWVTMRNIMFLYLFMQRLERIFWVSIEAHVKYLRYKSRQWAIFKNSTNVFFEAKN